MKNNVTKAAEKFILAKREYYKHFDNWFISLPCLFSSDSKRFWELAVIYRDAVITYSNRTDQSKLGADEFYRASLYKAPWRDCPDYTFDEALAFGASYGVIKKNLYEELFEIVTDKGDDSYGDLLDNIVLCGPEFYIHCLQGDYKNNDDIKAGIERHFPGKLEYIWQGENYNEMMLRNAASKYFENMVAQTCK